MEYFIDCKLHSDSRNRCVDIETAKLSRGSLQCYRGRTTAQTLSISSSVAQFVNSSSSPLLDSDRRGSLMPVAVTMAITAGTTLKQNVYTDFSKQCKMKTC